MATEAQSQPTSASEVEDVLKQKSEQAAEPRQRKRHGVFKIAIAVIAIVAIAFGVRWWLQAQKYESTDDSYVTGHTHPVSFRVSGTVSEVLVDDNQQVKAGQSIAKLDPRDYIVQLQQTEAGLQQARAQLNQSDAQINQAQAQLQQSQAQAESLKARFQNSQRLADRNRQLFSRGGAISQQDLDNSIFQMLQDQGAYESAEAAVKVAAASWETARAQRGASLAQVSSAEANVENAKLQLSYTTLHAPADGRVAKKTLEAGQRVQPAQSIMAVVEANVWVVANFKETQLGRIQPGQNVKIAIDAIRNKEFSGKVDSFQRGTGAVFSLLPPDNATGNFTKIVQRVPVKIVFNLDSIRGYEDRIVPGLSTVPSIKVKMPAPQKR